MPWRRTWRHLPERPSLLYLPGRLWGCLTLVLLMSLSLATPQAQAQLFRDLAVFGDSLSDTGNALAVTRLTPQPIPLSPPYASGRFSNGPVWVENLATRFGLQLSPSLDGGLNFAFGGAENGVDTRNILEYGTGMLIPSLRTQVDTFRLSQLFDDIDPATLYIVWGGGNDIRNKLRAADPLMEVQGAVNDLARVIRSLADADAVYFLVANLPDLGLTPESRGRGPQAMAQATAISMAYNNALAMALDAIEAERQVVISRLDTFAFLQQVAADPAAFGFSNITDACLEGDYAMGGAPCAAPAEYLFWDRIHPTGAAHALLARFAAAMLPPLIATRAPNSPEETAPVTLPAQDLPVLQVRLGTGDEAVRLSRLTVEISRPMQQAGLVQSVRARLSVDTNANGRFDAGEAVLATAQVQGAIGSLPLELTTPFDIPAAATAHLLVSLDLNSATASRSSQGAILAAERTAHTAPAGWLAALLPGLAALIVPGRGRKARLLGGLMLYCGVLLTSCDTGSDAVQNILDNGDDSLNAFTVVIPAQGITAQGATSAALTLPPVPITGATVKIRR